MSAPGSSPEALGRAPALRLRACGARSRELLELAGLLCDVGLRGVRVDRPAVAARGPSVAIEECGGSGAAQPGWQLWTLPSLLHTRRPGLAVTILAAEPARPDAEVLRAVREVPAPRRARGVRRLRGWGPQDPVAFRAGLAEAHSPATIEECGVLRTVGCLLQRPRACDLIVAPPRAAARVAALTQTLAGPGVLATELRVEGPRVVARARGPGVSGLLLATARALGGAGRVSAQRALLDGWLCALEDGVGHDRLPLLAPRQASRTGDAFLAAVRERLGRRPRWVRHPFLPAPAKASGSRLRLLAG